MPLLYELLMWGKSASCKFPYLQQVPNTGKTVSKKTRLK